MPAPAENAQIIKRLLQEYAAANGLPVEFVTYALAVASQESNFASEAVNDGSVTKTNEYSVGPWQINLKAHPAVTVAQAQDPVFSTRHRLPSLAAAWQKLGGTAGIAQLGPEEFQGRFHQMAQVSWKPTAAQSRAALTVAGQVMGGNGGFTMPQSTTTVDPVMQQEFQRAQANYSRLSQRASYLQQQLERPDLDQAARTRYQGELSDIIEGGQLKAARDEMLAFWSIVNPGKAEAPSARMNAEANWIKTQYDIARGFYSDQLNYGQLALEIIKANNAAAGAEFEQWYRTQQISQGDLGLLMEARAKQQAEQLALLGLRLQQAEFISKQQAWNAVNLFQQAEAGQKLYQPGFGPNDAMAQAGRMLGLNAPVIEARPVNEADFDPINILKRSGEALPAAHDDAWWGVDAVQARLAGGAGGAPSAGLERADPAAILPGAPVDPRLVDVPGAGDADAAATPALATAGANLRGGLEALVNAVATAPVMPATTHTRAGVDAVTAAIQQWMPYSPANNLTESERAAGLQAAGNPFVAEGRPDGSYQMDEKGRMLLLPERTPPANQSQPNPVLPMKNWVFDPSKKRWVYRPAGG